MDAYLDIATVAASLSMQRRVTSCAAQQHAPGDPEQWTLTHRYSWAAAPGWGAAWASSMAAHPDDPTWDPGVQPDVVTDGMILGQIQLMLGIGPAGQPTAAWPVGQIVAWLAVRGVILTPDALADLDVAELLNLAADLDDGPP